MSLLFLVCLPVTVKLVFLFFFGGVGAEGMGISSIVIISFVSLSVFLSQFIIFCLWNR